MAAAARDLAQALADAAAGVEARAAETAPAKRVVPVLSVFALADQVAVTAGDLRAAADALDGATPLWWQGGRRPLADVLEALAGQVERVRSET